MSFNFDGKGKVMKRKVLLWKDFIQKKKVSIHTDATTSYPCCVSALGEFRGSCRVTLTRAQMYSFFIIMPKF